MTKSSATENGLHEATITLLNHGGSVWGDLWHIYMDNKGGWYGDFGGAIQVASDYFKTIRVHGDGLDVVVMGIDETALSNMEFFRKHNYGNAKVGIFFVSARSESQRDVTAENLIAAGYDQGWEGLILRQSHEDALTNKDFKSLHRAELERKGYRILFNIGDQWSDLEGPPENRGFKLSNPMYYRY
ncbi:hypothetical protein R1sor_010657 [Riccia sorocarpa]|uniref:Acid phosphatase n=1 Tax=Riccia sorocarpa TaxID=122646 RepID=A0ABD3I2Q6_9MARC